MIDRTAGNDGRPGGGTLQQVPEARLRNKRLVGSRFARVADALGWFGAVQAQDFAGAKCCVEADVDAAFERGELRAACRANGSRGLPAGW